MTESVTVTLTHAELRTVLQALGASLDDFQAPLGVTPVDEPALVCAFFKLTNARNVPGGMKPNRVELSQWATAALATLLTPPAPKKAAKAKHAAPPAKPKRRRTDTRRRHDKPKAPPTTEVEDPLNFDADTDAPPAEEMTF